MKIRNGFVSNSSSSSFLLITTKENHEKAFKQLSPYEKAVIKTIVSTGNFLGRKIIWIGDLCPMDYSYTFEELKVSNYKEGSDPEAESEGSYEAFSKYENIVNELSDEDEIFSWSMG